MCMHMCTVDFTTNMQTCRQWQIQGVPCMERTSLFEPVSSAAICGKIAATLAEKTDL